MLIDQPAAQAYKMGRLEFVMEHMARDLESPRHNISVAESELILKEFVRSAQHFVIFKWYNFCISVKFWCSCKQRGQR